MSGTKPGGSPSNKVDVQGNQYDSAGKLTRLASNFGFGHGFVQVAQVGGGSANSRSTNQDWMETRLTADQPVDNGDFDFDALVIAAEQRVAERAKKWRKQFVVNETPQQRVERKQMLYEYKQKVLAKARGQASSDRVNRGLRRIRPVTKYSANAFKGQDARVGASWLDSEGNRAKDRNENDDEDE